MTFPKQANLLVQDVSPDSVETTTRLTVRLHGDDVVLHELEALELLFEGLLVALWGELLGKTPN